MTESWEYEFLKLPKKVVRCFPCQQSILDQNACQSSQQALLIFYAIIESLRLGLMISRTRQKLQDHHISEKFVCNCGRIQPGRSIGYSELLRGKWCVQGRNVFQGQITSVQFTHRLPNIQTNSKHFYSLEICTHKIDFPIMDSYQIYQEFKLNLPDHNNSYVFYCFLAL